MGDAGVVEVMKHNLRRSTVAGVVGVMKHSLRSSTVKQRKRYSKPATQSRKKLKPAQNKKKPASTRNANSIQASEAEHKDELLEKCSSFKQFDTVGDYSDHHYAKQTSDVNQPSQSWAKLIQEEWKMLQMGLPEKIFVRVYEERMDLLRAVIVGPAGTPYHDGLFFFDVSFPSAYPNVPPRVYYHSGGLRLNPNLYDSGYVCLSLVNTWQGSKEERWVPGQSTILQLLVSIQGLVLNTKPYFNEPGYVRMAGTENGEKQSQSYNENTFILSCRTMVFSLNKPPKHFEEYVGDHFRAHAQAILIACKAYMEGTEVGCLVEGVQDAKKSDKSCSDKLKTDLGTIIKTLANAFIKNGSDLTTFLQEQNIVT